MVRDESTEEEFVKGDENSPSLVGKTLMTMGRLISSIVTLIVIYLIVVLTVYIYYNFKISWLGYLVIFFSLKTKVLSLMFCEAYGLSDGTTALRRVFLPDEYMRWDFSRRDRIKLRFFMYDPYIMLRTDWKHNILPYNLTTIINARVYVKRVWFPFLLQIVFGLFLIKGYLDQHPKEFFLVVSTSLVLGNLCFIPDNYGRVRDRWYRSWGFPNLTIPDIFYLTSMGMLFRGKFKLWRFLISCMVLTLAILNYKYDLIEPIRTLIGGGKFLWESLQPWIDLKHLTNVEG